MILHFIEPTYSMLRVCDIDNLTLHLTMNVSYYDVRHEGLDMNINSLSFFDVIFSTQIARWTKSCSSLHCMTHSPNPNPKSWWVLHGSSTPLLRKLEFRLFVQTCSSWCCENIWSAYSFVHSMKRNKKTKKSRIHVTTLFFDDLEVEVVIFTDDRQEGDEIDTIFVSSARQ
ncbi:hypothetical protein Lal_00035566 [Lupinus albus]|nr:hypothetical protein Lal_00035546 [Lupinus albus]KAF1898807.1 hypothetical protein Lal_00035566 [Lupinus albus]